MDSIIEPAGRPAERRVLSLKPDLKEAVRARRLVKSVTESLGFSPQRSFEIQVAAGEAVANAIEHAEGAGEVRLDVNVLPERVEISVLGTGEFQLPGQDDGRLHRGLGLPLMAKFADHFALYSAAEGGTLVTLTFYRPAATPQCTTLPPGFMELARGEAELRRQADLLAAINRIFEETLSTRDEEELGRLCLQVAEEVTGSHFALLGEFAGDGRLHLIAATPPDSRAARDRAGAVLDTLPVRQLSFAGVCAKKVAGGQPVYSNRPSSELLDLGMPSLQSHLDCFLAAPLIRQGKVIGAVVVANREGGYGESELASLQALAPAFVAGLFRKRVGEALRASEERFRATFEQAAVGIAHVAADGRFIRTNQRFAAITGYSQEELRALSFQSITHPDDLERDLEEAGRLARGEVDSYSLEKRYLRKDGSSVWIRLTASRVGAHDDPATYFVAIIEDISDRKHAEQEKAALRESYVAWERERRRRSEALLHVTEVAVSAFDSGEAAQTVLEYLVEQHGFELANVWLARGEVLELVAAANYPDSYRDQFSPMPLSAPYDAPRVFRSGKRVLVPDASLANPSVLEMYGAIGVQLGAYLILPLRARGRAVGTLHFGWHQPRALEQDDLDFYTSIANELGVVLENAELYKRSTTVAETLQESLVFVPGEVPGVRFGHAYRSATEAARLGGDFLDVFALPSGEVAAIVGDVSGKGVEAAHVAFFAREAIRAYLLHNGSPRHVMRLANEALIHRHGNKHFVTVALMLLDPLSGRLKYSLAGHPPPVVVSPAGAHLTSWKACPPLGAFADASFSTSRSCLEPGGTLVFYTDGITEARRDDRFLGEEGLLELLGGIRAENPEFLVQRVLSVVTGYAKGSLRDDAALLALTLA